MSLHYVDLACAPPAAVTTLRHCRKFVNKYTKSAQADAGLTLLFTENCEALIPGASAACLHILKNATDNFRAPPHAGESRY